MAIKTDIQYADVDDLWLDPLNPRLGRGQTGPKVPQATVLDLMKDWALEELAISFIESGFWPHEAVLVAKEQLYGKPSLVVIEGNRRLAALKYLKMTVEGTLKNKKWQDLIQQKKPSPSLFKKIPYIEVDSRKDVSAFLGFRHVTGIKEWRPAEKAEYIAKLIEDEGLSYEEVMRKIGSKTPTVRQNYISYNLLIQMEDQEEISVEHVEDRFSVLFLSLRTEGVRKYLHIDVNAEPKDAMKPVPKDHLKNLQKFALWLFGSDEKNPLIKDSRQVDDFGRILESPKAVEYLERTERPTFEMAYQLAGGDEPEVVRLIEQAADNVEAALSRAHRYAKSKKLRAAALRLGQDTMQLVSLVPGLRDEVVDV
jgi:ParB-like chromosome segregation protein Spo0J